MITSSRLKRDLVNHYSQRNGWI